MPNGPLGSGVTTATSPTTTSPVVPLIEITSPSRTTTSPTENVRVFMSMWIGFGSADRGLAHAARDDGRVTHEPAAT